MAVHVAKDVQEAEVQQLGGFHGAQPGRALLQRHQPLQHWPAGSNARFFLFSAQLIKNICNLTQPQRLRRQHLHSVGTHQ